MLVGPVRPRSAPAKLFVERISLDAYPGNDYGIVFAVFGNTVIAQSLQCLPWGNVGMCCFDFKDCFRDWAARGLTNPAIAKRGNDLESSRPKQAGISLGIGISGQDGAGDAPCTAAHTRERHVFQYRRNLWPVSSEVIGQWVQLIFPPARLSWTVPVVPLGMAEMVISIEKLPPFAIR
jgi:hypothetical protein